MIKVTVDSYLATGVARFHTQKEATRHLKLLRQLQLRHKAKYGVEHPLKIKVENIPKVAQ